MRGNAQAGGPGRRTGFQRGTEIFERCRTVRFSGETDEMKKPIDHDSGGKVGKGHVTARNDMTVSIKVRCE